MSQQKPTDARTLMVLGLLTGGPKHGYELLRILLAHGSLSTEFKKPTLYHLLHRLTLQGAVQVHAEGGTRGRRGERLVFGLTGQGESQFQELLRQALSTYDRSATTFEVATAYLPWLPPEEAQSLLGKRRQAIATLNAELQGELAKLAGEPPGRRLAARGLALDHAISLLEAETAWLDRAMTHLGSPTERHTLLRRPVPPLRRAAGD